MGERVLAQQRASQAQRTRTALPASAEPEPKPTPLMRGADLLRLQRSVGNHAVAGMLQRYYEPKIGNSTAKYRFSDNDGMAVKEEASEGGKQVWATQDLMDSANATLKSAGSAVKLNKGG